MKLNFISFYLVLVFSIFGFVSPTIRRSYGEVCSKIHKCDRRGWFSCQEGICKCSKEEEMLYDEERNMCVTKSGERCKYGLEENGESSLVEITGCVPHADCSSDGICMCDSKHHEIFNGTCGLSLLFGENCSEEDQCSKYDNLQCVEGVCQCKEGEAEYSEKEGQCVGLDKNVCIHNKCIEGAICLSDYCMCDSNHYESPNNTCLPKKQIFESCTRDVQCLQSDGLNLQCISGICNCPAKSKYSKVQKYEYRRPDYYRSEYSKLGFQGTVVEMCAPIIDQPCSSGYCMENSFCELSPYVERGASNIYSGATCKCFENFSPNRDSAICAKNYGMSCIANKDCIDDLFCSNGKCDCPSPRHQFFDFTTKTCMTKIGGLCTNASVCVSNSFCSFLSENVTHGHCECNEGFVINKDGTCDLVYGQDCTAESAKCDSAAGLVCLNNKCSCPDIMYTYSSLLRKCVGLVGANCNPSEESNMCVKNPNNCNMATSPSRSCVVSAHCFKVHPLVAAKCKCMDDYEETEDNTCRLLTSDDKDAPGGDSGVGFDNTF